MKKILFAVPLLFLLLAACKSSAPAVLATPTSDIQPAASGTPALASPIPASATEVPPTPTWPDPPTESPEQVTPATLEICPPLADMAWAELPDRTTNPFNPPRPGSDDPHQGVDIADFLPDTRVAISGRGIQAVLAGTVSTVLDGRFPFGYGLIVETPLDQPLLQQLDLPPPHPEIPLPTTLTCSGSEGFMASGAPDALYLMYAHMAALPGVQPGDALACGDAIGAIGESGNALNPHLHLEVRVGPAGASFPGMTHYNPSALPEEMDAYCAWRVSGLFRLVDPGSLFALPGSP